MIFLFFKKVLFLRGSFFSLFLDCFSVRGNVTIKYDEDFYPFFGDVLVGRTIVNVQRLPLFIETVINIL